MEIISTYSFKYSPCLISTLLKECISTRNIDNVVNLRSKSLVEHLGQLPLRRLVIWTSAKEILKALPTLI